MNKKVSMMWFFDFNYLIIESLRHHVTTLCYLDNRGVMKINDIKQIKKKRIVKP